jgi:hypothetical protein
MVTLPLPAEAITLYQIVKELVDRAPRGTGKIKDKLEMAAIWVVDRVGRQEMAMQSGRRITYLEGILERLERIRALVDQLETDATRPWCESVARHAQVTELLVNRELNEIDGREVPRRTLQLMH